MSSEHFASFCVVQAADVDPDLEAIRGLASACEERLRYWEILYVAGESTRDAILARGGTLSDIRNLRVLFVSDDASYYRRRLVGAAEAIDDVVTLTAAGEMRTIDVIGLAEEALDGNQVILASHGRRAAALPVFHWFLSLVSAYRVSPSDMKTIALSRPRLVALLARPSAAIDLRFEAKRGVFPYVRKPVTPPQGTDDWGIARRFEFFAEIVATSTPRVLKMFAMLSVVVLMLSSLYGLYAVGVVLTQSNVQRGWFSTALIQSGSVAFIALSFTVLSLGVARIAERLDGAVKGVIIDEIGNVDFFDGVDELNVEGRADRVRSLAR